MKNFEELKLIYGFQVVTAEQFNAIEESEQVDNVQHNGCSGLVENAMWYTACSADGDEFDFYTLIG